MEDSRDRPTPVRELMESARAGGPEDLPSVSFDVGGELWTAQAVGAGRTGTAPDRGAPVLLLRFSCESGAGGDREAIAVASSLAELGSECLEEVLARSVRRGEEQAPRADISEHPAGPTEGGT